MSFINYFNKTCAEILLNDLCKLLQDENYTNPYLNVSNNVFIFKITIS